MIRRDAIGRGGERSWLLVEQIVHARLAGGLAGAWRWPTPRPAGHEAMLRAIDHHDDGWAEWDAAPELDRDGKPLAFTEMSLVVSTAIWRRSIAIAEGIDPLATYMVAGHFRALLERHASWRSGPAEPREAAEAFLRLAGDRMAWAREACGDEPSGEPLRDRLALDDALRWLQLFDAASLWLCCTPAAEGRFELPCGGGTRLPSATVRFVRLNAGQPQFGGDPGQISLAERIAVEPWPFDAAQVGLVANGRVAPARPIATDRTPFCEIGHRRQVAWTLTPGG